MSDRRAWAQAGTSIQEKHELPEDAWQTAFVRPKTIPWTEPGEEEHHQEHEQREVGVGVAIDLGGARRQHEPHQPGAVQARGSAAGGRTPCTGSTKANAPSTCAARPEMPARRSSPAATATTRFATRAREPHHDGVALVSAEVAGVDGRRLRVRDHGRRRVTAAHSTRMSPGSKAAAERLEPRPGSQAQPAPQARRGIVQAGAAEGARVLAQVERDEQAHAQVEGEHQALAAELPHRYVPPPSALPDRQPFTQ